MVKYRTEEFSGSGIRDAVEVMAFEINTLNNTDILRTLSSGLLHDTPTGAEMEQLMLELEDGETDAAADLWYIKDLCRNALREIKAKTSISVKYALWLASYDDVCDTFWPWACGVRSKTECRKPGEKDIMAYETGPVILADDDGAGGMLYGYCDMPAPLMPDHKRSNDDENE